MLHAREFNYFQDAIDILFLELRESDVKEIKGFTGLSPEEALLNIVKDYDSLYLIRDGYDRLLGIFGVILNESYTDRVGEVVFLASDPLIEEHKKEFIKKSKGTVEMLLENYDYLYNYVSSDNKDSIRWLEWLGFKIYKDSPITFEDDKVPFYFFMIERS